METALKHLVSRPPLAADVDAAVVVLLAQPRPTLVFERGIGRGSGGEKMQLPRPEEGVEA